MLLFSAGQHCPGWEIDVRPITPAVVSQPSAAAAYVENTQKLEWWTSQVLHAADGDRLLLVDTDTMVTGPLDPLWDLDFDIALTCRPPGAAFPLNGGVIGVRVNARSRGFFRAFNEENARLLVDRQRHEHWRQRYGGINQAALGVLLSSAGTHGARVLQIPCRQWNCEDSTWASYHPEHTRIVHIKSALRRAAFHGGVIGYKHLCPLVRLWRDLEAQATAAGVEAPLPMRVPPPDAPVTRAALARPRILRRRGRPQIDPTCPLIHTSVRIPKTLYEACASEARRREVSIDQVIREALSARHA